MAKPISLKFATRDRKDGTERRRISVHAGKVKKGKGDKPFQYLDDVYEKVMKIVVFLSWVMAIVLVVVCIARLTC